MKIIAFYLPQFHSIPENDRWWGKGFTEWTNVKKSKPVIKGQVQPKVPLNNNYYCLLDDDVKKWQVNLAKKAGIYGFCYYHYWFNGKLLLEKPAEQMLKNRDIDFPFCFSWANEPWSRSWKGENKNIIMDQNYGSELDWKKHYDYLKHFFKDKRYIKENGKPMFIIYKPDIIPECYEMMAYWDKMAKEDGFPGIYFGCQFPSSFRDRRNETKFNFAIEFEPLYTRAEEKNFLNISTNLGRFELALMRPGMFIKTSFNKIKNAYLNKPIVENYVATCKRITNRPPYFSNAVPGMFTGWDKTPRNGNKATIYIDSSPSKFGFFLRKQIERAKKVYKSDYLFVTAWNEWGEGAYLEPDKQYRYGYLGAVKKALNR